VLLVRETPSCRRMAYAASDSLSIKELLADGLATFVGT
jgi:hypothetical protein